MTSVTNALNQKTTYNYNALGYLTSIVNPNLKTQASYTYDAQGRLASSTDSEGYKLSYSYDNFDRLIKTTFPDGTFETKTYNKLDLASETDREGRKAQYVYDAVRNLVRVIDPLLYQTSYSYYPNQSLKTLTDANNNVTTWVRDLQSRVIAKTYDDGRQYHFNYENTTSRLKSVIDARNQTKQYSYFNDDQLKQLSYLNAINLTPNVSFSYDPYFSRVVSMTDGTGTTQYQYYAPGVLGALELKQSDGPYTNDTYGYQYDALGRETSRNVANWNESYSYDTLGRLVNHSAPIDSYNYTYLGETRAKTGLHNAPPVGAPSMGTDWVYDTNLNDRRMLNVNNSGASRSYAYVTTKKNFVSNVHETVPTGVALPIKDWAYTYDADDRLTQALVAVSNPGQYTYNYDPVNNLTGMASTAPPASSTNYAVNNLNQVATANTFLYKYDANGNLTEDESRTYLWDAENRLLKINYKAAPTKNTQFRYDGLGHWVGIISTNGTTVTETRYLWCGDVLCASRNASETILRRYFPEGELSPAGTRFYYERDRQGSIRDVLVIQNGASAASYDYDAYGKLIAQTQVASQSVDFRYAGMFYLQEAGLYLTNYRAYNPANGRWLSRDPIGETGGINLYAYVGGNPVNLVDPLGLAPGDAEKQCADNCGGEANVLLCRLLVLHLPLNTNFEYPICKCKKSPNQKGKEGEDAVRSKHDIGDRERYNVDGRNRISDGSNKTALSEVKNVTKQSFTQQIKDGVRQAQDTLRDYHLYLPKETIVSKPLQNAMDAGIVTRIPYIIP